MSSTTHLNSQELQNLDEQLRITSREAEIVENMAIMPGAPPGLTEAFMKNIMDFEDRWDAELARYVTAWREAIRTVAEYRYNPVTGIRIDEELAEFTFDLAYALVRKDSRREEFSGRGLARLVYDGTYWGIRDIRSPGFEMPGTAGLK